MTESLVRPSWQEALRYWHSLGWTSFGGPAAQIAMMHQETVERRRWISEEDFLSGLNLCMLLPGPEAQQLAIYLGLRLHGRLGGLVAGILFILPAAVIIYALSLIYVLHGDLPWFRAALSGLKPVVLGLVVVAAFNLGRRVLKTKTMMCMAIASLLALVGLGQNFAHILIATAAMGWLLGRLRPHYLEDSIAVAQNPHTTKPAKFRISQWLSTVGLGLILWWLPILGLMVLRSREDRLVQLGIYFSKVALMTFGGAYAILPEVMASAVEQYHWLDTQDAVAGLAFAETTPGPLIIVLQFIGFLAGWHDAGKFSLTQASAAAALTTWMTFVPSFIWIFALSPMVAKIRSLPWLRHTMLAISASIVGVIASLAIFLAKHTVLSEANRFDWSNALVVAFTVIVLVRRPVPVPYVIAFGLGIGFLKSLTTLI